MSRSKISAEFELTTPPTSVEVGWAAGFRRDSACVDWLLLHTNHLDRRRNPTTPDQARVWTLAHAHPNIPFLELTASPTLASTNLSYAWLSRAAHVLRTSATCGNRSCR